MTVATEMTICTMAKEDEISVYLETSRTYGAGRPFARRRREIPCSTNEDPDVVSGDGKEGQLREGCNDGEETRHNSTKIRQSPPKVIGTALVIAIHSS